jgi:O-antigen/teichoic acid export membrane protein
MAFCSLWRFTAGAGAFTATSMMFNQVDRVVLSKMVSLENFGYYNLAGIAAGAIYRLVLPIFTALFPLFSSLLAANDLKRLTQSYHRGCELASVLIWPATAVGVLFSRPILLAWTRNAATADATHVMMALLLAGSAFNALIYVPYALQLAYGWTTLGVYMNVFGLVAAAALLPVMISFHGAAGAAAAKLLISCAVFAIGPWIMHRRILTGETLRWYVSDVAKPFAVALVCAGLAALAVVSRWPQWLTIAYILGVFGLTSAATALVLEDARATLLSLLGRQFGWFRKAIAVGSVRTL